MTTTLDRRRTAAPAIAAVVAATGVMLALALWSFATSLARLIGAATLTAESLSEGYTVPAAAVDGRSSGTLEVGRLEVTHLYDGNNLPLPEAHDNAAQVRAFLVPFEASAVIDALFVLSLAAVVLLLCLRLVRGRPFLPHVTVSLVVFAVLTAVFSIGSQVVRNAPFASGAEPTLRDHLALMLSAVQAPEVPGIQWANDIVYTPAVGAAPLDLTLLGMAVLLGLVAAAFAIGQRMQRDTQGLV